DGRHLQFRLRLVVQIIALVESLELPMRRLVLLLVGPIIVSVLNLHVPIQPQQDKKPRLDAFGDPLPEGAVARLGTVRWRPGLALGAVVYSPDGKIVASG